MSTDYGYINARVRGMKTNLLGDEFYSEALASSDFRAFLSVLGQSRYMHELEESQSRYEGLRAVDDALARDFFKTTRSLLAASDRPGTNDAELVRLRAQAREKAAKDPAFRRCAHEVSRGRFECAMRADSADHREQCLL